MPRHEKVFSVFLASPSDVAEERTIVQETVQELNVTWSRDFGIRLELIRFETDVVPGRGEDPQAVINSQVPNDFDLFIGIMWCKFGTPTGRAGSGTVEEFNAAVERYVKDPLSIKIMFYFKDEPVNPSKLDLEQYSSVMKFRKQIGEEGQLYWTFQDIDMFKKLIRMHLSRILQEWKKSLTEIESETKIYSPEQNQLLIPLNSIKTESEFGDEDLGIYDYQEMLEEHFENLSEIGVRIHVATNDMIAKFSENSDNFSRINSSNQFSKNAKGIKLILSRIANIFQEFGSRVENEASNFERSFELGLSALNSLIQIYSVYGDPKSDIKSILESRKMVDEMKTQMIDLSTTIESTRRQINDSPPLSSELNKAKKYVSKVLQSFSEKASNSSKLLHETEKAIASIID